MEVRRLENHNGVGGRAQFYRAGVQGVISSAHEKTAVTVTRLCTVLHKFSSCCILLCVCVYPFCLFFECSLLEHQKNSMPWSFGRPRLFLSYLSYYVSLEFPCSQRSTVSISSAHYSPPPALPVGHIMKRFNVRQLE